MSVVTAPERNLVLVHSPGWQDRADFLAIKAHVEAIAPDIAVFVASNDIRSSVTRKQAAGRPTLIFSPVRLLAFRPARGKLYAGTPMSKLDEMHALGAAGLPVPRFEVIAPATRLSSADYGALVVIKPSYALASWGQGVELRRTETVRYRAPEEFPDWHPGRHAPMVAQQFVDCGYPMTCRALTIFGRPIFTYCREFDEAARTAGRQGRVRAARLHALAARPPRLCEPRSGHPRSCGTGLSRHAARRVAGLRHPARQDR